VVGCRFGSLDSLRRFGGRVKQLTSGADITGLGEHPDPAHPILRDAAHTVARVLTSTQGSCSVGAACKAFADYLEHNGEASWFIDGHSRNLAIQGFNDWLVHTRGYAPSTASTYAYGIIRFYATLGVGPDAPNPHKLLALSTKRTERTRPPRTDLRDPLPRTLLEDILSDSRIDIGLRATIMVSWNSALRIGELLNQYGKRKNQPVSFDNFKLYTNGYRIRVFRKSGKWETLLHVDGDRTRNPAAVDSKPILDELARRETPGKFDTPFVIQKASRWTHISNNQVTAVVREAGKSLTTPLRLAGHSVRIGVATEAYVRGMSLDDVQRLGSWSSETFLIYVRPTLTEWSSSTTTRQVDLWSPD
jgi:integrase